MVNENFNQASALIKRLMEDVGGSVDAYEQPLNSTGLVLEEEQPSSEPQAEEATLDQDSCFDGILDFRRVGDKKWTSPVPITDEYECGGVVEDHEELLALYLGFEQAIRTGKPQLAVLDSGTYPIEKTSRQGGWELRETIKNRVYCQETSTGTYSVNIIVKPFNIGQNITSLLSLLFASEKFPL